MRMEPRSINNESQPSPAQGDMNPSDALRFEADRALQGGKRLSRRDFLAASAGAAAISLTGARGFGQIVGSGDPGAPGSPIAPNARGKGDGSRPDVIQVTSDIVVRGRTVHKYAIKEMLSVAVRHAVGAPDLTSAWRSILKPDDVIGLKFNQSAAGALGTTPRMAGAIIESLVEAGFDRRQIVAIETPEEVYRDHGVLRPTHGWSSDEIDFGSGTDQLSDLLNQVTAIINIPFLKTHNIAGMTGCLKNLSHALVRHPARYHGQRCAPYIADINALPQIREKVRLHLVNALRVVFDGGPMAKDDATWDAGVMLAGVDPVALDTMGLEIINTQRTIYDIAKIAHGSEQVPFLDKAMQRGLGNGSFYKLKIAKYRM